MASGVMVEDDAGNLYFLRPEILEAAKLPKALHKDAAAALKASKASARAKGTGRETAAVATAPKLKVVGALTLATVDVAADQTAPTPELSSKATQGLAIKAKSPRLDLDRVKSTVMCPW